MLQDARVLVVDDSRLMRMALMRALTDLGVQHIKEAKDGRDALTKIGEASFDLMLLDMEMPEMTGIELLLAIKAEPELGAPPVPLSAASLMSSKQTSPATSAVVVAIAGMIFPAMPRDVCRSASGMR